MDPGIVIDIALNRGALHYKMIQIFIMKTSFGRFCQKNCETDTELRGNDGTPDSGALNPIAIFGRERSNESLHANNLIHRVI